MSHATLEPDPLPVDQRRLPRTDVMLAACSHERHAAFDLRKKPNSFSPCNLDYRRDSYNSEFALIALRLLRCGWGSILPEYARAGRGSCSGGDRLLGKP